jgi:hypothetical protein
MSKSAPSSKQDALSAATNSPIIAAPHTTPEVTKQFTVALPPKSARRNPLIRQKRQQVAGNLLHSNYTWEPERATGNRCFDRHPAGSSSSFDIFTQS